MLVGSLARLYKGGGQKGRGRHWRRHNGQEAQRKNRGKVATSEWTGYRYSEGISRELKRIDSEQPGSEDMEEERHK